jgi:hypothetical protein
MDIMPAALDEEDLSRDSHADFKPRRGGRFREVL